MQICREMYPEIIYNISIV